MCGRFATNPETVKRVAKELQRDRRGRVSLLERILREDRNLAPTELGPIIRPQDDGAVVDLVRWGFTVHHTKAPIINARCESVAQKPTFAESWRLRRCLVVADCFYEWDQSLTAAEAKKKRLVKQPWRFSLEGDAPMVFAGIWQMEPVEAFAILTTEANHIVGQLHDRMPVILPREHWNRWMDPETSLAEIAALQVPYVGGMVADPVTPAINRAGYDGPVEVVPLCGGPQDEEEPPTLPEQGLLF